MHATCKFTALTLAIMLPVGCSGLEPGSTTGTEPPPAPQTAITELPGGTSESPAEIGVLALDPTAGGQLVERKNADPLPAGPPGTFALFDSFGSLSRLGDQSVKPDLLVGNIDSGRSHNFHSELYVGKADRPDGLGYIGDFAMPGDDLIVWIARHEVGELSLDDYDVFSKEGDHEPIHIGSSTPDVEGVAVSVPGSGNFVTVVGDYAWWVEGELDTASPGGTAFTNIYAAPLDGTRSQRVVFEGAQYPHADRCTAAPRISYVTDSTSTGLSTEVAALKSVLVDDSGSVVGDTRVLWTADSAGLAIDGADACGSHWAVAYTDWSDTADVDVRPSGVIIGGPTGVSYFELPLRSTSAGALTVTQFGAFFFDWGGSSYGRQYFYSFETEKLYFIGNGASFGFTPVGDNCAAMAAEVSNASGVGPDYALRTVCTG